MNEIDFIKDGIKGLFETNPNVHVTLKLKRPKVIVEDSLAKIVGVYNNIFQLEEIGKEHPTRHTVLYTEVLTGNITVRELNYLPPQSSKSK